MSDLTRFLIACLSGGALTFLALYFLPFGKSLLGHDRGRKYVRVPKLTSASPQA